MLPTSRRVRELGTENAFVVLGEVERLKAEGHDIVSFCIGQPDFPTPDPIRLAGIGAIADGHTGYTPSPGIPALRAAVAAYFTKTRGVRVEPEEVVCGCGAKPFIGYAILSVTDYGVGDEVIYPTPGFPIYSSQIAASGAVPVPLALRESHGFRFDLNELADRLNERTRMLILCSPQNPTGSVLTGPDLEALGEVLAPFPNVWVYSDEVYSGLVYDGVFQSIVGVRGMRDRTILVDSVSKTYAMTGWRVGYAANAKLAPLFTRWVTNTDSCAPHPNQYAALAALEGSQESAGAMRDVFHRRRDVIVDGLNAIEGIVCQRPGGAFYVWPNVTEACRMVGAEDSEELRKRLLTEAGVAVLSDIHFGSPAPGGAQHVRFSYASSFAEIDEGLSRIATFIRQHKK